MTKKAEEHMSKIAGDFCNWLRDLPGEDRAINSLSETQLRVNNDRLLSPHTIMLFSPRLCLTRPSLPTQGQPSWRRASGPGPSLGPR